MWWKSLQLHSIIFRRCLNVEPGPYKVSGPLKTAKMLGETLAKHVASLGAKSAGRVEEKILESRSMDVSHDRAVVPIGSDPRLQLEYINWLGYVRFGRILEDLDTFAVWLCYKHNQGGEAEMGNAVHHPMAVVTACVDRIDLHQMQIVPDKDMVLDGYVSWVGRSSLETTTRLFQQQDSSNWIQLMKAKFVMVSRNPHGPGSVPNHPLHSTSPEETIIFRDGNDACVRRKKQDAESLLRLPPTESERQLLHEAFLKTIDERAHTFSHRVLPEKHVWMEDAKLKSIVICFPAQRNLYNKIFGGYLMRKAFELAWANAAVFSRSRPAVISVDDIVFRKAVDVGSLLFLSSQVNFTRDSLLQVRVHAEVVDAETAQRETTNTFHFTFSNRTPVPSVMPKTYADGMLYLSGKRHLEESMRFSTN